jgi:hypothetical protein
MLATATTSVPSLLKSIGIHLQQDQPAVDLESIEYRTDQDWPEELKGDIDQSIEFAMIS